jgi:hypothetical protein
MDNIELINKILAIIAELEQLKTWAELQVKENAERLRQEGHENE